MLRVWHIAKKGSKRLLQPCGDGKVTASVMNTSMVDAVSEQHATPTAAMVEKFLMCPSHIGTPGDTITHSFLFHASSGGVATKFKKYKSKSRPSKHVASNMIVEPSSCE